MTYELSPPEAHTLEEQGMLRGIAPTTKYKSASSPYYCHRCHHHWTAALTPSRGGVRIDACPACKARDWSEFLLLRCNHCHAVFESEQIRYKVGSYDYGDGALCPPYELFPLCPYCSASGWCPVEDARIHALRLQAARRTALLRLIWFSVIMILVIILAVVAVTLLR
jgi:NAD-dependent SIR2 family protein deacetylase